MFTTVVVGNSQTFVDARPDGHAADLRGEDRARGLRAKPVTAEPRPASAIMAESLAIIDRELGPEPRDPAERAVVRRMIHASADFDFATQRPVRPGRDRRRDRGPSARGRRSLTDVEMLRAGIRRDLAGPLGVQASVRPRRARTRRLAADARD